MATKPVMFDESMFVAPDEEDAAAQAKKARQKLADAIAPVIAELNTMATDAVQRRAPVEKRWLEDLRQYHGVYEAEVASVLTGDASRSQVFINITRPKTNAWSARMSDMLFPNDEKNWGINPTPVPQLTSQAREASKLAQSATAKAEGHVAEHNAQVDQGQEPDGQALLKAQDAADVAQQAKEQEKQRSAELEEAKKRAKAMESVIDDQLVESNYPARCRDAIDDETKLGSCVLKGPILNGKSKRYWDVDENGNATLLTDEDPAPKARRVNPWHFFPDPTAESMEDCGYTFERHLPNKKMLRKLAREIGFDMEVVAALLKEGPRASGPSGSSDLSFMAELRSMESGQNSGDTVDALKDRYLVWEYHGPLEVEQVADLVRMMGRAEDADALVEGGMIEVPMVRVFFCGSQLLKIDEDYLLDSCASVYSVGTFEKGDACVLGGIGVPRLMRNEQQMLNSAVRMMLDNAALAVGPQIIVDKEQIAPENGKWQLTPRKVWQWIVTAGVTRREKPFEAIDIPMNQEMLAAIVQLAVKFTDEAVAMPLIAQGEMGSHVTKTSSGMSMLFNSANVVFRRVVKNWDDDISAPLIQRFYEFNMQFSPRDDIKGDMRVQARGTSVLLVREMQAEQLMAIIREWSMHPILGVGFRAYHAMRMVLQAMSIEADSVLLPEDEYLDKLKQMSEGEAKQSPEDIRAQTALEVANIDAASRKEQSESNERIAQMRVQQAFAELGANKDISLKQIEAMFQTTALKESSKERQLAAEIGVERENAREARARGEDPTGSGGAISMGSEPAGK